MTICDDCKHVKINVITIFCHATNTQRSKAFDIPYCNHREVEEKDDED